MALVALSQQDEYGLAHTEQDCRGWTVTDPVGTVLGTCTDMIVNTEAERIEAIVLNTGARIQTVDISLLGGTVLARSTGGINDQNLPLGDRPVGATAGNRDDLTLPVMEERIQVGKRQVSTGGVRVTPHVTEQPVEQTVTLREERLSVERRAVNDPATTGDLEAFRDGVMDITETGEEVVVAKQARVVEEVVVSKAVTERQEVVRDTVTRTDVDLEPLAADTRSTSTDAHVTNSRTDSAADPRPVTKGVSS